MSNRQSIELRFLKQPESPVPSPAALAFANRITIDQFRDIYHFAMLIDQVAEEARQNERQRIFRMSFWKLVTEYFRGKSIQVKS